MPSFAYVTNSSQCDNSVLSTYTGPANLTANWTGNNIEVTWYNGDTRYASNSCTYGGNLTMPSSIPQKTGYTFRGWRVRQAAPVTVAGVLSAVNTNTDGTTSNYNGDHFDYSIEMGRTYNAAIDDWDYDYLNFGEVAVGEWSVTFPYGTVFGVAECRNSLGGTEYGESDQEYEVNPDDNGDHVGLDYCYCRIYGFEPDGGTKQIDSSSFEPVFAEMINPIYAEGPDSDNGCKYSCASECAIKVETDSSFRTSVYAAH